jgi:hypothetical protein
MVWVYAIVPGSTRHISTRGHRGERLRTVTAGRLAAVFSERRSIPRTTERVVRAHHAVVERLARELPAVIPVRFGTAFPDLDELTFVLRTRSTALGRTLRLVRRRVQMTARVTVDSPELDAEPPVDRRTGTAYLKSRSERASRPARHHLVEHLRHAVRRWVRDERVEQRGRVISVYHLVPRGGVDAYLGVARRAAAAVPGRIIISGPCAPYAFAGI